MKKNFHVLFLFHPHGLERGSYYYIIIQYENRKPRKITRNEPENNVFGFNTIIKIVNSRRIKIVGKASCISVKKIVNSNPKISLNIVLNCGHVVNIEQPLTFNFTVISFLNKV